MVGIIILIQPAALPPCVGLGIQYILHIFIGSERITGKSPGMSVSVRKQGCNGQTDKKRFPDLLLTQEVRDQFIALRDRLSACSHAFWVVTAFHSAVSHKIQLDIIKIPFHKALQLPPHLLLPYRMRYVEGNCAVYSRQRFSGGIF